MSKLDTILTLAREPGWRRIYCTTAIDMMVSLSHEDIAFAQNITDEERSDLINVHSLVTNRPKEKDKPVKKIKNNDEFETPKKQRVTYVKRLNPNRR